GCASWLAGVAFHFLAASTAGLVNTGSPARPRTSPAVPSSPMVTSTTTYPRARDCFAFSGYTGDTCSITTGATNPFSSGRLGGGGGGGGGGGAPSRRLPGGGGGGGGGGKLPQILPSSNITPSSLTLNPPGLPGATPLRSRLAD